MKRGISLLEVLVGMALMALLSTVFVSLFVFGTQSWQRSTARSQAEEQTLEVLALLSTLVRHANPDSLALISPADQPTPIGLSLLSCLGPNGSSVLDPTTGEIVWQNYVVIYQDAASQQVMEQQTPLQPPTADVDPATIVMTSFSPSRTDRVVARQVTSLNLTLNQELVHAVVQANVNGLVSTEEISVAPVQVGAATPSPSVSP
jgi:hypothetical protein